MRRFTFFLFVALFSSIIFSCAGFVYDKELPPEQSSKVWFYQYSPTNYNGVDLGSSKIYSGTFPEGPTEFSGNVNWSTGDKRRLVFKAKDAGFSCNLEGGENYSVIVSYKTDEETKQLRWGVEFYKGIPAVGFPPKEWLIAYIPFDPPVMSNDPFIRVGPLSFY